MVFRRPVSESREIPYCSWRPPHFLAAGTSASFRYKMNEFSTYFHADIEPARQQPCTGPWTKAAGRHEYFINTTPAQLPLRLPSPVTPAGRFTTPTLANRAHYHAGHMELPRAAHDWPLMLLDDAGRGLMPAGYRHRRDTVVDESLTAGAGHHSLFSPPCIVSSRAAWSRRQLLSYLQAAHDDAASAQALLLACSANAAYRRATLQSRLKIPSVAAAMPL